MEKHEFRINLRFEVADVKKPLIAVKRICEKGNLVSFGPEEGDNFIQNRDTGDKVLMRPSGKGSYMMDVCFVNGTSTSITVDSGAEENVCPWEWGAQFGTQEASYTLNLVNASGGNIPHWGKRVVKVVSPF